MFSGAVYDLAVQRFARSQIDWENDEMRVALMSPDYLPRQDSDASIADIRRYEVAASGSYRRGGMSLGQRRVDHDALSHRMTLSAGDVSWEDFTGSFRYAVVYQTADGSLVCYTDFGLQEARNATVSINYPDGVCDFEVTPALAS